MEARSHLDTAGSSINGNTAVMLEAALSSAVMHQNVVQTYDYQTRSSSLSGGQVSFALYKSGINVQALWQKSLEAICRSTTQIWVAMGMPHSITVHFFCESFAHCKAILPVSSQQMFASSINCNWLHISDSLCFVKFRTTRRFLTACLPYRKPM